MWNSIELKPDQEYQIKYHYYLINLKSVQRGFYFTIEYNTTESYPSSSQFVKENHELSGTEISFITQKQLSIRLQPYFYDLPLYYEFSNPIKLLNDSTIDFYLSVTIPVRLIENYSEQTYVDNITGLKFDKAVFGDPNSGIISNYQRGELLFDLPLVLQPNQIIIPVNFENQSGQTFDLNNIFIETSFLNIYKNEQGILLSDKSFLTSKNSSLNQQTIKISPLKLQQGSLSLLTKNKDKFKKIIISN